MVRTLVLLSCVSLAGCALTHTTDRPVDYADSVQQTSGTDSLFRSDASVLSDADIEHILSAQYVAPELSRVALLPFGWSTWSGWSEEMALSADAVDAQVLRTLRASAHIFDASFLPSILVPGQRTVGHLREAAARYQSDLLLVFRSTCQSFQRYRLFQAEQTRAYCSVEAVLLDVRTGLVPFVATSTQNLEAIRSKDDLELTETILRAQLSALSNALAEVSGAVVEFIERSVAA